MAELPDTYALAIQSGAFASRHDFVAERNYGFANKSVLFQQCVDCHMSRRNDRLGVASIPSIIHSGGFDSGAQMGVVHPLTPAESGLTGQRVAKYKSRHESFRRMLEHLGE